MRNNNTFAINQRSSTCPFSEKNAPRIDYKDLKLLSRYITEKVKNYAEQNYERFF